MLAVPSKCFQVPVFVTFVTTATTPVKAPIICDLDYRSHLLTGLPVPALALLRSLLNTAAKVILLNCASDLSLLPQNSPAAFHLTQSESQRPHGGLWGLPLSLPLPVCSPLIDLLALPETHQACGQLRARGHALVPPAWCLDALRLPPSPAPPQISAKLPLTSFRLLFKWYLTWEVFPDDLVVSSTHLLNPTLPLPLFLSFVCFPL